MQIAVYGKGGIGKSTVSANLSAALAALAMTNSNSPAKSICFMRPTSYLSSSVSR